MLVARMGDTSDPWFVADNLITFSHSRGFLTEQRFITAVTAEQPSEAELTIVWRTHTLCWSAESCLGIEGDYVECGSYQGYSMAVVLRYLAGLPGRQCFLYDLFDPSGGVGEGKRLPAHAPELFERVRARFGAWPNVLVTRGRVPDVLAEVAPRRIAFLHVDMNNAAGRAGRVGCAVRADQPRRNDRVRRLWLEPAIATRNSRWMSSCGIAATPCWNCRPGRGWW